MVWPNAKNESREKNIVHVNTVIALKMQYNDEKTTATSNKIVPFVHLLNHYVAAAIVIAIAFFCSSTSFRGIFMFYIYVTPFKDRSMQ